MLYGIYTSGNRRQPLHTPGAESQRLPWVAYCNIPILHELESHSPVSYRQRKSVTVSRGFYAGAIWHGRQPLVIHTKSSKSHCVCVCVLSIPKCDVHTSIRDGDVTSS